MTVTIGALAGLTGARLIADPNRPPAGQAPLRRVVVDSRAAAADTLFVALAGNRADGHDYLAEAFAAGAAAALIAGGQWQRRGAELQAIARPLRRHAGGGGRPAARSASARRRPPIAHRGGARGG